MIADKIFKSLGHTYEGYSKHLNGQALEPGYKPDFVLRKSSDYIILESENSSSRKTFVGGMMKAAHYFQNDRTGKLIFVIVPKENTSAFSIAKHLGQYLKWIECKTNLRDVFVIEADLYYGSNVLLTLDCKDFEGCAFKV